MRKSRWVIYAVALGMMAATAWILVALHGRQLMGPAGVKISPVSIYDTRSNLVATQSIVLPGNIPGMMARALPVDQLVVDTLPKDTTYGLEYYKSTESSFAAQATVILMGTDHTSIHQPQYCLYAQDWTITNDERVLLHMERPFAYDIPAVKLTAIRQARETGQTIKCFYVYWFVTGDKITAEETSRLLSMGKTILQKGELERWAYISYFVPYLPGNDQATYDRLEKLIQATVPEFQTVTGRPTGALQTMTAPK